MNGSWDNTACALECRGLRACVLVLLCVLIFGCGEDEDKKPAPSAVAVTAIKIQPQDVPIISKFIGKTRSVSRVEIRARVEGFLEKRLYHEGLMVNKGDHLFQMDPKPFEAKLQSSKAALEAQKAALKYAQVHLDRTTKMVNDNVTARKELDFAISNYKTTLAGVEEAKAQVVQDELELGYTRISSPIHGLSSFAKQEVGAYINNTNNSLLTYIAQLDPMRVEFSVSENQVLKYHREERKGLLVDPDGKVSVEIELVDGTVYPHKGEITFSGVSLSDTTGTFLVRAVVPNPDGELRPGMFVRINLSGAVRPNAVVVPQKAVQQNPKSDFVWVVDKNMQVNAQPIVAGDWYQENYWFIDKGLKKGDVVVVEGVSRLADGVKVDIKSYVDFNVDTADTKQKNKPQKDSTK